MSAQDAPPPGMPPLWVAVGVIVVVGVVVMVLVEASTRRQTRQMNELLEAAHQARRDYHAALLAYLSRPSKPAPKQAPEAITVELEVVKPEDLRKGENERD